MADAFCLFEGCRSQSETSFRWVDVPLQSQSFTAFEAAAKNCAGSETTRHCPFGTTYVPIHLTIKCRDRHTRDTPLYFQRGSSSHFLLFVASYSSSYSHPTLLPLQVCQFDSTRQDGARSNLFLIILLRRWCRRGRRPLRVAQAIRARTRDC